MPYLNPYHLLEIDPALDPELVPGQVKRAKRRVLARFELEGKVTLPFGMYEFDKAQILAATDDLSDPEKAKMHRIIYGQKELYRFLSDGFIGGLEKLPNARRDGNLEFWVFLSPHIRDAIRKMLADSLAQERFRQALLLVKRQDLLLPEDLEKAYQPLRYFYQEAYDALPKLVPGHRNFHRWIHRLGNRLLVECYNFLPDPLREQRDHFGHFMVSFANHLSLGDKSWHPYAALITEAGMSFTCNPQISNQFYQLKYRLSSYTDTPWKIYVENAKLDNQTKLGRNWDMKLNLRDSWPKLALLVGGIAAGLLFIFLISSGGDGVWKEPPSSVPEWKEKGMKTWREYLEYKSDREAVMEQVHGPTLFTLLDKYTKYTREGVPLPNDSAFRPASGYRPYAALMEEVLFPRHSTAIHIHNYSEQDAIFFLMHKESSREPYRHVYVGAGESWLWDSISPGNYFLQPYFGVGWNDKAVNTTPKEKKWKLQKRVGGFEKNAELINWPEWISGQPDIVIEEADSPVDHLLSYSWDGEKANLSKVPESPATRKSIIEEQYYRLGWWQKESRGEVAPPTAAPLKEVQ